MKIDVYNDNISYVTDEVSTIPTYLANLNQENREKFVTDLAAVSRGKGESKNPSVRFQSLLKEAALSTPSRPVEFCPIILNYRIERSNLSAHVEIKDTIFITSIESFFNDIAKFSYITNNTIYTNLRCLLNAGIEYEDIPFAKEEQLEEYKQFKAIKANIPMYVWSQVPNTHTQISKEAQSDRLVDNIEYWLPEDIGTRLLEYKDAHDNGGNRDTVSMWQKSNVNKTFLRSMFIDSMLKDFSQREMQEIFNSLGYKREIWARAPYYFKYKECVMTGWRNDPKVWEHLFLERGAEPDRWKNWVQPQTALFVKAIRSIIE